MKSLREIIASSSSEPVLSGGSRLGIHNARYPFVGPSHILASDGLANLINGLDYRFILPDPQRDEVCEFLALASAFHLFDGWRYLSNASHALLTGATRHAIHLSYYAELRAARSILANSGIFIGNKEHFACDKDGKFSWLPTDEQSRSINTSQNSKASGGIVARITSIVSELRWRPWRARRLFARLLPSPSSTEQVPRDAGTHVAVWWALTAWALSPTHASQLPLYLRCLNYVGCDWPRICAISGPPSVIINQWLQDWAVDLKELASDQYLRNRASYGVDGAETAFDGAREEHFEAVVLANRCSLPIANDQGDEGDLGLLNDFCFKAARMLPPIGGDGQPSRIKEANRRGPLVWERLENNLIRAGHCKSEAEAQAVTKPIQNAATGPLVSLLRIGKHGNKSADAVFARAYFMMRLAADKQRGFWREMHKQLPSGLPSWEEAILASFAGHSNLPDAADLLGGYTDLQRDVEVTIEDYKQWREKNGFSVKDLWSECPTILHDLCKFERIGLFRVAQ